MSYIPDDEYQIEPFFTDDELDPYCQTCHKSLADDGDDHCIGCRAQIDAQELEEMQADTVRALPVLKPIEQRPVELNASLWAEWKRIAEKVQS